MGRRADHGLIAETAYGPSTGNGRPVLMRQANTHPRGMIMVDISSWVDTQFCPDCSIIIANGDSSGIPDDRVGAHLAAMNRTLDGYDAMVGEDLDLGFYRDTCGGCGEHIATDDWHAGWLVPRNA